MRGELAVATIERLYRRLGWIHAGTIPRYALDTDGQTPNDAVIFYKELAPFRRAAPFSLTA